MEKRIGLDMRMFSSRFTGIGRVNYELAKYLCEMPHEHTYVFFLNEPEFSTFPFSGDKIEKVLVNAKYYSWEEQLIFLKKIWEAKIDLMHFTHFNSPIFYTGKQLVTIHDMTLSFFPGKKMTSPLHRLAYQATIWSATHKAERIIAVSENTKKDIINELHIASEKINVCYEGASDHFNTPPTEEQKAKTKKTFSLQKPFFLYTGVQRNHKNVVGLIEAFYEVRTKKNLDFDLVITGKKDPFYPEVEETVHALGIEQYVHFTGLVEEQDLHALYYLASVYVFPSFYEGFGITPLEAITTGLPVACSNTSCLPEVCGPESVLYFDPYNKEDIAEKMYKLATDKEFGKKLVEQGKEFIKKYSWKKMAEETLQIYTSLLK